MFLFYEFACLFICEFYFAYVCVSKMKKNEWKESSQVY